MKKKKLHKYWEAYHSTHHGAEWWRALWERSGCVRVEIADLMPAGYDVWLLWDKTLKEEGVLKRHGDVEMLELDGGNLTFTRIIARKHVVRGKNNIRNFHELALSPGRMKQAGIVLSYSSFL